MPDRARHGGVLPIGNAKLFGGLLHNPGQWSIVGVAHKGAQMMDDVMVETAREPAQDGVRRRVIGCGSDDAIPAGVKLTAFRRKVRAFNFVHRLEYQPDAYTN